MSDCHVTTGTGTVLGWVAVNLGISIMTAMGWKLARDALTEIELVAGSSSWTVVGAGIRVVT